MVLILSFIDTVKIAALFPAIRTRDYFHETAAQAVIIRSLCLNDYKKYLPRRDMDRVVPVKTLLRRGASV
jgi:hypothetical protein